MKQLKAVQLLKQDTCYTYALKRAGLDNYHNLTISPIQFISENTIDRIYCVESLEIGDIFCYEPLSAGIISDSASNIFITNTGKVLAKRKYSAIHFAVYEGDGIMSHAIYDDNKDYEISLRLIESLDGVFRINIR